MLEKFLAFEQKFNLFNEKIQSVEYWHLIRFSVYSEIVGQKNSLGQANTSLKNKTMVERVKIKFKQIPKMILKGPFFLKSKDVLILNHSRRVKNERIYECIYTDRIISKLNHSHIVLEDPILDTHLYPIPQTNIKYTDYIHNLYLLRRIIYKFTFKKILDEKEKLSIRQVIELINKEFNLELNVEKWIRDIGNAVLQYKVVYKHLNKIVDKVNPKIILEVVSYGPTRFAINEIAKKRNIPTVELQHGTMGKYHIAYNFAEKKFLRMFPDYVFLFGRFWKDNTRLPIEDSKIKIVGWPFYEHKVKENKYYEKQKNVVLFISQGPIGKKLSKLAVELMGKIKEDDYKIIYKLHPGEYSRWKNEYPWLIGTEIEVIDNNEHDLHFYLAQADIQVGVSSTALFEGLGYGLRTIIYKTFSHQYMEELYSNNLVFLVESSDELKAVINLKDNSKNNYDISYFWKENGLDNILLELNKILEKKER